MDNYLLKMINVLNLISLIRMEKVESKVEERWRLYRLLLLTDIFQSLKDM